MAETRKTRPVSWIKAALKEFESFPLEAQSTFVTALTIAAEDGEADIAKPMHGLDSGVFEIALAFRGDAFRVNEGSFEDTEEGTSMKSEKLELVRGSGNLFRDLGRANADVEQLKALLAAEIIKALDRDELTVRAAHARTGFAAADFSRIRTADLARFTADRLVSILNRLGSRVEVRVRVRRIEPVEERARA